MRALAALRMVWNVFFTHLFTTVRVHLQFLVFVFRLEVRVAETCRAEQEFVIVPNSRDINKNGKAAAQRSTDGGHPTRAIGA
jgi:hypothetical protein